MFVDYLGLKFLDHKNCGWIDRATSNCPEYESVEDYVHQWLEKQKDKICGAEACDKIVKRCVNAISRVSITTATLEVCYISVAEKCREMKEKCKDSLE